MELVNGLHFKNIRGDIFGGLTSAVVALPLALAFGVASGAGAMAGLYGAVFVGFFAAIIGGTPSQISGPTGPMTVVMAVIITQYGDNPALAFTVVIMGGALQILFGSLRLGHYVTYMPFSVISGFMTGIGVIIILLQLAPLLGYPPSSEGVLHAIAMIPDLLSGPFGNAALLGVLSLAIVSFTPLAVSRFLPAPLLALLTGTLLGVFALPGAPVIGEIPTGFPEIILPDVELSQFPGMISSAITLAMLGSIDSLLTSLVADNFTRTYHQSNRELVGQGVGNMVAGLFGAIPGAGATMRTVVNIRAGGKTPLSGALHSVVLLAVVLGLGPLAEQIPHAVLAGILLKVGYDIIDWQHLRRLHKAPRGGMLVTLIVLLLTVVTDLVLAVGVGVIVSSLISANQMSEEQLKQFRLVTSPAEYPPITVKGREILRWAEGRILVLHLSGAFSYCSAKEMVRKMGPVGMNYRVVVLDLEGATMIDTSIALALEEIIKQCQDSGRMVLLSCSGDCVGGKVINTLDDLGILRHISPEYRHPVRLQALRHAKRLLEEEDAQAQDSLVG
ncbi:MAG: SulP family inorganic anion transporter [Magnetococcales bacterium]|nr:SulP family inorganic anion transporter [Magnetococcales bacterium]